MILNDNLYLPEDIKSSINNIVELSKYFKSIKAIELIKYEQGIIAQLNTIANNNPRANYDILDCIQVLCFDNKDRFATADTAIFNILKCMANRFEYRFKADPAMLTPKLCVFLSLLSRDNYMKMLRYLIPDENGLDVEEADKRVQDFICKMETEYAIAIADTYYPMNDAREFITTTMTGNLDKDVYRGEVPEFKPVKSTIAFADELVKFNFRPTEDTVQGHPVLFKYILEVMSNDDVKLDFMKKYVLEVAVANDIHSMISEKVTMFERYFKHPGYAANAFIAIIDAIRADSTYRDYYLKKALETVVEEMLGRVPPVPTNVVQNFVDSAIDIALSISSDPTFTANMIDECHTHLSNTISRYARLYSSERVLVNNVNSVGNISESAMECFFSSTDISGTLEGMQYTEADGFLYAAEAYKKSSKNIADADRKIYKAFKKYKNAEGKVDSQITKFTKAAKNLLVGDTKTEIIEGKKFSVMSLLRSALGSAALFAFGPIQGLIALVVKYTYKKSVTASERKKILIELEGELEIINEKIEDARGDNNRQAKYAMMRTRTELQNAIRRIKLGVEADNRAVQTAKDTITKIRGGK